MPDNELKWERHMKNTFEKTGKIIPKLMALTKNRYGYNTRARKTMLEGGTVGT